MQITSAADAELLSRQILVESQRSAGWNYRTPDIRSDCGTRCACHMALSLRQQRYPFYYVDNGRCNCAAGGNWLGHRCHNRSDHRDVRYERCGPPFAILTRTQASPDGQAPVFWTLLAAAVVCRHQNRLWLFRPGNLRRDCSVGPRAVVAAAEPANMGAASAQIACCSGRHAAVLRCDPRICRKCPVDLAGATEPRFSSPNGRLTFREKRRSRLKTELTQKPYAERSYQHGTGVEPDIWPE